jgi:hypothetical protein
MAYSEEEKIKILYEQSLCEIRDLVGRIEQVATVIAGASKVAKERENGSYLQSTKSLDQATKDIHTAMQQVTGLKDGMQLAAASSARAVLLDEDGPIAQLGALVRQQRDALGWLNRAANTYAKALTPSLLVTVCTALCSAVIGGLFVRYL